MLRAWMNVLPLFVVRWFAKRHCEVFNIGGSEYYMGTNGVLFAKARAALAATEKKEQK